MFLPLYSRKSSEVCLCSSAASLCWVGHGCEVRAWSGFRRLGWTRSCGCYRWNLGMILKVWMRSALSHLSSSDNSSSSLSSAIQSDPAGMALHIACTASQMNVCLYNERLWTADTDHLLLVSLLPNTALRAWTTSEPCEQSLQIKTINTKIFIYKNCTVNSFVRKKNRDTKQSAKMPKQ